VIEIVNSHHVTAWMDGNVRFPLPSTTLIAKGTYHIERGKPAVPSDQPDPICPDMFLDDDDPAGILLYPSDLAIFKPSTDVLIRGSAYAPNVHPVFSLNVSVEIGAWRKDVRVVGNRKAYASAFGIMTGAPEPFVEMPLSWSNSFGGPGFDLNPAGKGFVDTTRLQGGREVDLPNLELASRPIENLASYSRVGFGPVCPLWPDRRLKLGTFDESYCRQRWPWLPADLDWSFYNAAPPDQQMNGYLRGDERVRCVNLDPEYPEFDFELPGERVRCFYSEVIESPIGFVEVPMALDTLWIDLPAKKLVLLWRGNIDLANARRGGADRALYVSEPVLAATREISYYEALLNSQWEALSSDAAAENAVQADENDFDSEVADAPPPEPESLNREQAMRHLSDYGSLDGVDLSGADLSDMTLEGVSFRGAILTNAFLRRSNLRNGNLAGAVLSNADFTRADLSASDLTGADCTAARFAGADLTGAVLEGTDCAGASLRGARLDRVKAARGVFEKAAFNRAAAHGAVFREATLARATLSDADFSEADFTDASLEEASAYPLRARGAKMAKLRAADAAFWACDFRDITGEKSVWERADLRAANFSGADLTGGQFAKARMQGVNFRSARLRSARFAGATLLNADLRDADLYESSFANAEAGGAAFVGANVFDVDFTGCRLAGSDIGQTDARRCPTLP
jgi:uncharacterized protein YjbI with pentapeptide repeats